MSFKIVQTVEKSGVVLSLVPGGWEANGILHWPSKINQKIMNRLIKDASSVPGKGWLTMTCKVKRNGIKSFEDGQDEIQQMVLQSETEDGEDEVPGQASRQQFCQYNLNSAEDAEEINQTIFQSNDGGISLQEMTANLENDVTNSHKWKVTKKNGEDAYVGMLESNDVGYIECSVAAQPDYANEIRGVKNELQELVKKVSQIEQLLLKALTYQSKPRANEDSPSCAANGLLMAFPLKNYEQMMQLENLLSNNEQFSNQVIKKFSSICGTSLRIGSGKRCCYQLCDQFLDRKFLTDFSWTGSTRTNESKKSLRDFKEIIKVFLKIIHKTDTSFNMVDLEEFFKCVLKNSKKRAESLDNINHRASTPKTKKLKVDSIHLLDTITEENGEEDNTNLIN